MARKSSPTSFRRAYTAEPTGVLFHHSDAFVRGITGCYGSGKSVMCTMEIVMRSHRQNVFDGKRCSRWAIIRNCFDAETEILTERRGFVLFKDLLPDDKVATLFDGRTLGYALPIEHFRFEHHGEMIGFENDGVDFLVTPNHKLHVSACTTRKKVWGSWELRTAQELYGKRCLRVKRDADRSDGYTYDMSTDFFEWLGFWFAEGTRGDYKSKDGYVRHRLALTQWKLDGIAYARDLFRRAKVPFTFSGGTFRITTEETWLHELLSAVRTQTHRAIPVWVKLATADRLRAFIAGYMRGDGHSSDSDHIYTSSRQMADDLQEIALKAGLVANISSRDRRGQPMRINGVDTTTTAIEYNVTLLKPSKNTPALTAQGYAGKYRGWYKQQYDGAVYCVEVPEHTIYVRRRGRAHWSSQSYPQLISTTLNTWQDWVPEAVCPVSRSMNGPLTGNFRYKRDDDKTEVQLEVIFLALDLESDVAKLKSLELTGVWINEAAEIVKEIFDGATARVGRYPAKWAGGSNWSGIIMDTNPPDDMHWYYDLAENMKSSVEIEGHTYAMQFFRQPPAVLPCPVKQGEHPMWAPNQGQQRGIPPAENVDNQNEGYGYWLKQTLGKDESWIRVFLMGEYGTSKAGKPIYPEYVDQIHCAKDPFDYMRGLPVILGWDYGRTPSCVFAQVSLFGQVKIVHEITSGFKGATYEPQMSIRTFAKECVKPYIQNTLAGMTIRSFGDPAGSSKGQTEEITCMQILADEGIPTVQARTNEWVARRDSVAKLLRSMVNDGQPAFLMSQQCRVLRRGFQGHYRYKSVRTAQGLRTTDEPDKDDPTCQPHDSLQYACLEATGVVVGYRSDNQDSSSAYSGSGMRRNVRNPALDAYT